MNKKLMSNTIYLYLLTFVKMFFPLITLPFFTRIFSIELYGVVTYVKSYTSYVQLVLDFGFLLSATKNISLLYDNDNNEIDYIIGNTIIEKIILLCFMAFITLYMTNRIPILMLYKNFTWLYFVAISLNIFVADYLFRGIEKMAFIAIPYTVAKSICLLLTLFFVRYDSDLLLIPFFELLGNGVASLISIFLIYKNGFHIKFGKPNVWLSDLKESAVYFVSNFATTVFGSLTTIIGGIYFSLIEVSYWGIAMQVVTAAKSMYTPISNSIYPYMIRNKDMKLIHKICILMTIPMVIGSIVVIFWGNAILEIIAGEKYSEAGFVLKLLLPVIISSFYSMIYGWPVLGAIGKVKETTISTITAALFQLIIMFVLIMLNEFTIYSLAASCALSEVFLLIIRIKIYKDNSELFIRTNNN